MSWLVTSLVLTLGVAGCTGSPSEIVPESADAAVEDIADPSAGPIVAEVSGVRISAREFEAAAARKVPADGVALSAAEKKEVIDELVVEKILYLEAKRRGIDRDPKVQKVMVNTLLRQEVYAGVRNSDFTQEELLAYFEAHKDEFVVPEKVQVRRIFIKGEPTRPNTEAKELSERLRAQVVADPGAFRELASEHSEDPYRRRGGDLGYLAREGKPGIDQEVVERAFGLQVGEVAEVFESGGGFNVVLVSGRRDRVERTFEQMKGSVLRKVKNDRYKQLYGDFVDDVRGRYDVAVEDAVLAGLEVRPSRRLGGAMMGPGGRGDDDFDLGDDDFPE